MTNIKRNILLVISAVLFLSAILFEMMPTTQLYNKLLGKPQISGFQTEFKLSDYKMKDAHNNSISWQALSDKPLYLTAGFTNCPYSCPTTMAFYRQLSLQLKKDAYFALLTVDPDTDTPQVLSTYLKSIDPNFIGLRIEDSDLFVKAIGDLKQSVQNLPGKQNITHSDYIYLIHPALSGLVIYNEKNKNTIIHDFKILSNI